MALTKLSTGIIQNKFKTRSTQNKKESLLILRKQIDLKKMFKIRIS